MRQEETGVLLLLKQLHRIVLQGNLLQPIHVRGPVGGDGVLIASCVVHVRERDIQAPLLRELLPLRRGVDGYGAHKVILRCVCPVNKRSPPC